MHYPSGVIGLVVGEVMPWYSYICSYGHEFETEQGIKDKPLEACTHPVTDRKGKVNECCCSVKRQLCASSFSLKGGGWSKDGYAKKGN